MLLKSPRRICVFVACLLGVAVLSRISLAQAPPPFEILHRFSAPLRAGVVPLVQASDGTIYAVMVGGGKFDAGAIVKLDADTQALTMVYEFKGSDGQEGLPVDGSGPIGLLSSIKDGQLYGTTTRGGIFGAGTIFSLNPTTGVFKTLHSFNPASPLGVQPLAGLMEASDGTLWGTTSFALGGLGDGTIFSLTDRTGNTPPVLRATFTSASTGQAPSAVLTESSDGLYLYGTTSGGGLNFFGTVFKFTKSNNGLKSLHHFTDSPLSLQRPGLLRVTVGAADQYFGFTTQGGSNGQGSVFKIANDTFSELTSVSSAVTGYNPAGTPVLGSDGRLWGVTTWGGMWGVGDVFAVDLAGTLTHERSLVSGVFPRTGLILGADGAFYGLSGAATIFAFAPGSFSEQSSSGLSLGPAAPGALVRGSDGLLYGTAASGGFGSNGALLRYQNGLSVLFNFGAEGSTPLGALIQAQDGAFYGTAQFGAGFSPGLIYSFPLPATDQATVTPLYTFTGTEGQRPAAGLLEGPEGLYGTTPQGGSSGAGTVFKISTSGQLTVLHQFSGGAGGAVPSRGSLVLGPDGFLYGATEGGGSTGEGTLYRIDTRGGQFSVLHEFASDVDGAYPVGLALATDSMLYGATRSGGPTYGGALFKLDPFSGQVAVVRLLDSSVDGGFAGAPPVEAGDGSLYGSLSSGGDNGPDKPAAGTIYRLEPNSSFHVLHTFDYRHGGQPFVSPVQGADNRLYGTAYQPGGVLFAISPTPAITNKAPSAGHQTKVTDKATPLAITLAGSDPDGDPLTFVVTAAPQHGTLTGVAPNLTYHPAPGYSGPDAIWFRASDGTVSSPVAGVAITVTNKAPSANGQTISTSQDVAVGVVLTGSDPDGDSLQFAVVTAPSHGALSGAAPNLTYTPDPGYVGPDSFTFTANDGYDDSTAATVSITVLASINHPPVSDSQSVIAVEGADTPIVLGASDSDGDMLTFSIDTLPQHGSLSGTAPNLTFHAAAGYTGPDGFTFSVNDGVANSNVATVSITIRPANRPPVANAGGPYVADLGVALTLDATASTDPDTVYGDSLVLYTWTVANTISLPGATPTLSGNQISALGLGTFPISLTVSDSHALTNTATSTMTIRGPQASFTVTPNPVQCGVSAQFDGSASSSPRPGGAIVSYVWAFGDGGSGTGNPATHAYAAGGTYTATLTVSDNAGIAAFAQVPVVVTAINHAPIVVPGGPYSVAIGNGVSLSGSGSSDPDAACGDSIASASWTVGSLPNLNGIAVSLTSAQIDQLGVGTHTATLTLTDTHGLTSSASTTLTVQPAAPADLTVSQLAVQSAGNFPRGVPQSINWAITNVSPTGAAAASTIAFYLSDDAVLGAGDILLATQAVPAMLPGSSFPGMTPVTVPTAVSPGDKFIIAVADANGVVTEKDETNNTARKSIKIKR